MQGCNHFYLHHHAVARAERIHGEDHGDRLFEVNSTIHSKTCPHDPPVYNMEGVMLLAFRLNSYQARAVRRELTERISRDHKPFEVVMTTIKGGKE